MVKEKNQILRKINKDVLSDITESRIDFQWFINHGVTHKNLMKILFVASGAYKGGWLILSEAEIVVEEPGNKDNRVLYVPPNDQDIKYLTSQLGNLGLYVHIEQNKAQTQCFNVFYSLEESDLVSLKKKQHTTSELGEFLGYPITAIQAYVDADGADFELPESITNHDYFQYLPFKLSRKYFQEEWKQFLENIEKVKQILPQNFTNLLQT